MPETKPLSINDQYERYSTLWFGADCAPDHALEGMCAEMFVIEEWAQGATATSRREHEQLGAITYAATGMLAAGVFLRAA
jgi:hypothetical protein